MKKILLLLVMAYLPAAAQWKDNVSLLVYGGLSQPQESFIGSAFNFPQLNVIAAPDPDDPINFARDVLGYNESADNFADYWENGLNLGFGLEYRVNDFLSAQVAFNYSNYVFNEGLAEDDFIRALEEEFGLPANRGSFDAKQGATNIYTITLNARAHYAFGDFIPYVVGGGGYIRAQQEAVKINYYDEPFTDLPITVNFYDEIPAAEDDSYVALAGAGIEYVIAQNVHVFVEGNYVLGFTEGENTLIYPFKFGFIFGLK